MSGIKRYLEYVLGFEGAYNFDGPDIDTIAAKLGGEIIDQTTIWCPSPGCPADDRSLVLKVYSGGRFHVYACSGSTKAAYAYVYGALGTTPPPPTSWATIERIIAGTAEPKGTVVERYLRSRAITFIPDDLRFHPHLFHKGTGTYWPGMVGLRTDVNGKIVAIHRTYLARDGSGKAPVEPQKMDLGPPTGTAIRLAPVAEEMLFGEGAETVASMMLALNKPGWAVGSCSFLKSLVLPPQVRRAILLVDSDDKGKSEAAANIAAGRLFAEGRQVDLLRAPPGKDFNDVWIEENMR